jgi:hypothetical protein
MNISRSKMIGLHAMVSSIISQFENKKIKDTVLVDLYTLQNILFNELSVDINMFPINTEG